MAKKSRASGEKYKRAIEWLFAKKLDARDVELSLDKLSNTKITSLQGVIQV